MKNWGYIVAGLYAVVLLLFWIFLEPILMNDHSLGPVGMISQLFTEDGSIIWLILFVLALSQFVFFKISVKSKIETPSTKRSVIPIVVISIFLFGLMMGTLSLTLAELFNVNESTFYILISFFIIMWIVWGFVFINWFGTLNPENFIRRQLKTLMAGSILELLIAVPSHIYVMQRKECCAGIGTFFGISCGISVMLFCFGPGVFFLYQDRIRMLKEKTEKKD